MEILYIYKDYYPVVGGIENHIKMLAEALVQRGHQVTVLTSHTHVDRLHAVDTVEHGVRIVRAPVLFRISKGVIMPTFGWLATRLVRDNDVI